MYYIPYIQHQLKHKLLRLNTNFYISQCKLESYLNSFFIRQTGHPGSSPVRSACFRKVEFYQLCILSLQKYEYYSQLFFLSPASREPHCSFEVSNKSVSTEVARISNREDSYHIIFVGTAYYQLV